MCLTFQFQDPINILNNLDGFYIQFINSLIYFFNQDLNLLFNLYDTDQSGALDYKEFSAVLFGKASSTASPQKGTSLKSGGNNGEALAEKLKDKLATRGARGLSGLAR